MLTAAQREARAGKLTASRVGCLMTGDTQAIMQLYREMIGEAHEEDLSDYWPVRLGEVTEQLQLDWYEQKTGAKVTRRGEVVVSPDCDWAACTLDGWLEDIGCPIDCKHVGGREPVEVVIERQQPQMHWQMLVTKSEQCALSIIRGADQPVVDWIAYDVTYGTELLHRAAQFMSFVNRRILPVAVAPAPLPATAARDYDMTNVEAWARSAQQWLQVNGAAETAKTCERTLKALVPLDARKCFGAGVRITRDRAGRLSLRVDEGK